MRTGVTFSAALVLPLTFSSASAVYAAARSEWPEWLTKIVSAAEKKYGAGYSQRLHKLMSKWFETERPAFAKQIRFQGAVLKRVVEDGKVKAMPIKEGETLTTYDETRRTGSLYKIAFQADRECHMYVIQLDETGKLTPLFPEKVKAAKEKPFSNPIPAGMIGCAPTAGNWWCLDETRGKERMLFLVAPEPLAEMQAQLDYFGQRFIEGYGEDEAEWDGMFTARGAKKKIVMDPDVPVQWGKVQIHMPKPVQKTKQFAHVAWFWHD